jgi:hypothetical protein
MNSMSGTAISGRVLMNACSPPGTVVPGPLKPHLAMERPRLRTRKGEKHRQVVLKIAADRQINDRIDPDLAQMRGWPDAGQH